MIQTVFLLSLTNAILLFAKFMKINEAAAATGAKDASELDSNQGDEEDKKRTPNVLVLSRKEAKGPRVLLRSPAPPLLAPAGRYARCKSPSGKARPAFFPPSPGCPGVDRPCLRSPRRMSPQRVPPPDSAGEGDRPATGCRRAFDRPRARSPSPANISAAAAEIGPDLSGERSPRTDRQRANEELWETAATGDLKAIEALVSYVPRFHT